MTAAYSVGETKVESSEGVTGGWISAGGGNLNPTQPPGPMPLPRRSPPPITPGSAPRYMIWLEQPYSRLFNLGGSWAGGAGFPSLPGPDNLRDVGSLQMMAFLPGGHCLLG